MSIALTSHGTTIHRYDAGNPRQNLRRQGFTRFSGALEAHDVTQIRAIGERYHRETGLNWVNPDAIFATRELRTLPFRAACVQAMRTLLGHEFYIVPDFAVNLDKFGGWHRDTGSQIADRLNYVFDPDFLHLTFGLYFQANDPNIGGGLNVVPKSHKTMRRVPGLPTGKFENLRDRLRLRFGAYHSIACGAGDLLAFDFRILHRASQPKRARPADAPLRIAAFWGVVRERRHAQAYVEHLSRRAERDPYFARLFPNGQFEFPQEVQEIAKQTGCRLLPE